MPASLCSSKAIAPGQRKESNRRKEEINTPKVVVLKGLHSA
ncbi:hypothetical protein ACPOL_3948 [Acidisarcina polymorpha]|uniref:Uncharacterized protein n=1 Tax=Acidisarcina polymorpha TaxID=2211140 RepID=A0A2Z5G3H2_9BACT|nr:hypothetical protein ACPOL_3948 [Acidisarcina polymorpha]